MSTFEFISVLLSIVVGLGLARLLSGVGRIVEIRRRVRFYWVQGVWVINIILLLVVFWWATLFSHAENDVWPFLNFLLLLVYSILIFLEAVLILPTDLEEGADLEVHFFEVRPWFFSLLALTSVAELFDTLLHGGWARVVGFGPYYMGIILCGVVINSIAARTDNRRYHGVVAIGFFLSMVGWILVGFPEIG